MSVNWHDLLLAWLHDPPDQVWESQGAPTRAVRYAGAVFGREYTLDTLLKILPEAMPRPLESGLPVPSSPAGGTTDAGRTTALGLMDFLATPDEQARRIHHPLSGAHLQLPLVLEMDQHAQQCEEVIATLIRHCPDDRARFLS